ncbi:hypothetical protein CTAYLR_000873 [Chrysophaeum taylorii]|uniref:Plastocyanin-like domain-containing protein n=1 Tax=Chrysophaeum taylorii TaxID=2483200 RepID=A0AAD7UQ47_9STRA|nr:hypothetical protein CTAYLR_000873 [Chrysophaeum taylorii]
MHAAALHGAPGLRCVMDSPRVLLDGRRRLPRHSRRLSVVALSTTPPASPLVVALSPQEQCVLSVRLLVAGLAGMCLGVERRRRRAQSDVGARTMTLVSVGAALFTMAGAYGFDRGDASRLASSVATGVGFIGAGVITVNSTNRIISVDGLTTASTVWCAAALGVAAGIGLTILVSVGCAIATLVLEARTLRYVAKRAMRVLANGKKKATRHRRVDGSAASSDADVQEDLGLPLRQPRAVRTSSVVTLVVEVAELCLPEKTCFLTRTYNGSIPGPTLVTQPGDRLEIQIVNTLSDKDNEARAPNNLEKLNTSNLNAHGLHVPSWQDDITTVIEPGETHTYRYDIPIWHTPGLAWWYHPHANGSSTARTAVGMFGMLAVEDDVIPSHVDEILLVVQTCPFEGELSIKDM